MTIQVSERAQPLAAKHNVPGGNQLSWEIVDGPAWDRILADFDGACQEQLYAFAHARWPSARHEPIVFSSAGEVVGGCLVMIQPLPLGLGAVAVTKWGPALKNASDPAAPKLYEAIIDALMAEYAGRRRMTLSVLPRVSPEPDNSEFTLLVEKGFSPGPSLRSPDRYLVDVRLSDAEQRKSVQQKWRNRLNKAERSGLVFERGGLAQKPEFDALFQAMLARKQYTDHSAYDTLPALLGHEVETLRPELFLVRHEGEAVAGAIVFKAGDTAVYLYGATNEKALPLSAGHFLQFNIIGWLRENTNARWYNLGGTDGAEGLHIFKSGLIGSTGAIRPFPPTANYAAHSMPRIIGNTAFWARDIVGRLKRGLEDWKDTRRKQPS
ncbi:GNAT family N-acetyltransferase [Devosia neptuniae]|uniref:GNAT family N-acetyltransferase n=1 Tax=Devosia neptuniae TaxID=191302 RepID=A0ABY6CH25_9HYPH|nr:GNAT family N-acetyltransferase [Devosia neptuniae]UXN71540.1 GNAT family N-acetyltransferase [Devosia neptuniae]